MDRWTDSTSTALCMPPSELWGAGLGIPCSYWGWQNPPHGHQHVSLRGQIPAQHPSCVPHHPQTEPLPQTLCLLPPRSQI